MKNELEASAAGRPADDTSSPSSPSWLEKPISRRNFLTTVAGGLVVGFWLPSVSRFFDGDTAEAATLRTLVTAAIEAGVLERLPERLIEQKMFSLSP